jgi:hypothetical protein
MQRHFHHGLPVRILEQRSIHHRGWRPDDGVERTLLDVDDGGHIHREIGVDATGQVVYIAPALRGPYPHGAFDLLQFAAGTNPEEDEFPRAEFEALWQAGVERFGARPGTRVS